MRIIKRKTLKYFYSEHPETKGALDTWYHEVRKAEYQSGLVFIRFIGTHKEYKHINAEEV